MLHFFLFITLYKTECMLFCCVCGLVVKYRLWLSKEVALESIWTFFNLTSEGPLLRYYICDDGLSDRGGIDV